MMSRSPTQFRRAAMRGPAKQPDAGVTAGAMRGSWDRSRLISIVLPGRNCSLPPARLDSIARAVRSTIKGDIAARCRRSSGSSSGLRDGTGQAIDLAKASPRLAETGAAPARPKITKECPIFDGHPDLPPLAIRIQHRADAVLRQPEPLRRRAAQRVELNDGAAAGTPGGTVSSCGLLLRRLPACRHEQERCLRRNFLVV
jgi:hypothetical protein